MMDFHILVVISCVFLASLCSLLFINKFFRRKTFEEIIAEKKAMTEKIYGQSKVGVKKPKKMQQMKKEQKREKKQRQKEQQHMREATTEQDDSDAQTDHLSMEDEPHGLSKTHVEFDPDPEIMTTENASRRTSAEKENIGVLQKSKSKKEKKGSKTGILVNKNEPLAIKDNLVVVVEQLNNFEVRPPKDVVELKRQEKDKKDDKNHKKEKNVKKEKSYVSEQLVASTHVVAESGETDEKVRQSSPKNQQLQLNSGTSGGGTHGHNNNNTNSTNNNNNNKTKQQSKKQIKETAATKELVMALDKLSETDTIGVSLLMNLFRRAELNRSEIQILIDYLLNKQQDMPSSHSEWSDDICQKLKRQLEEKERALVEEQEASIGIQAKLRELRTEMNTERAHMSVATKDYMNKIHAKEQEIFGLNQEVQTLSDKLALERQNSKSLREKQVGSQDVVAQLKIVQNELEHKDKTIAELNCMGNAARQAAEDAQQDNERLIHSHAQQIQELEKQREELEQISNSRIFELEKAKMLEKENAECKVQIHNLQNALELANADLAQACRDVHATKAEMAVTLNIQLTEKQQDIKRLQLKNDELLQQLDAITRCTTLQRAELLQTLTGVEDNARQQHQQQQELQRQVDALQADIATKHKQLQEVEQQAEASSSREKKLEEQLNDQKDKNNDLRMKNWKLVEALQIAETTVQEKRTLPSANSHLVKHEQQLFDFTAKHQSTAPNVSSATKEEEVRDIFERLYPDAVRSCASNALSLSFDQWVEQVIAIHVKQAATNATGHISTSHSNSCSNKATQSNRNYNSTSNSHNDCSNVSNIETTKNSDSRISSPPIAVITTKSSDDNSQKLHSENAQLRMKIDELTKLAKKTSNTLSELEGRAREQDEHWRSIVRSKDEQIYSLQHSNGEQSDI